MSLGEALWSSSDVSLAGVHIRLSDPEALPPRPYSDEEIAILDSVSAKYGVPAHAVIELIGLEGTFHHMGRRRGLFPALRAIVADVAHHKTSELNGRSSVADAQISNATVAPDEDVADEPCR